jgi:hypothetical protein
MLGTPIPIFGSGDADSIYPSPKIGTGQSNIGGDPDAAPAPPVYGRAINQHEEDPMEQYAIMRRNGWRSSADLDRAAARSSQVGDQEMPDDVRWIRSYVLEESAGAVGTVCIYEAISPEAIRRHAALADLPVDEIVRVTNTVVLRPDPSA